MSSFVRRMWRAGTKDARRKPSGIPGFGSQLGVVNPRKPKKNPPRGSRRGKRSKAYIERRKARRAS